MRIGFDAKRAFLNNTGLGNYSRDAIRILSLESDEHLQNVKPGHDPPVDCLIANAFRMSITSLPFCRRSMLAGDLRSTLG